MTSIEGVMITLQATNTGKGNSSSSTTVPVVGGPFRSQGKFHVFTWTLFFCFCCEQWPVDPVDPGDFLNASPNEWGCYASCNDSFLVMKLPVVTLIHQGNPRWGNSLFDCFPFKESMSIYSKDRKHHRDWTIYIIISYKLQKLIDPNNTKVTEGDTTVLCLYGEGFWNKHIYGKAKVIKPSLYL